MAHRNKGFGQIENTRGSIRYSLLLQIFYPGSSLSCVIICSRAEKHFSVPGVFQFSPQAVSGCLSLPSYPAFLSHSTDFELTGLHFCSAVPSIDAWCNIIYYGSPKVIVEYNVLITVPAQVVYPGGR